MTNKGSLAQNEINKFVIVAIRLSKRSKLSEETDGNVTAQDDEHKSYTVRTIAQKTISNGGNTKKKPRINMHDIKKYVKPSMAKPEANLILNKMIENGQVICGENMNKCNIEQCNTSFGSGFHLKKHIFSLHFSHGFVCRFPDCDNSKIFADENECTAHITDTHYKQEYKFRCDLCDKKFIRWNGMQIHLVKERCKVLGQRNAIRKIQIINDAYQGISKGIYRI